MAASSVEDDWGLPVLVHNINTANIIVIIIVHTTQIVNMVRLVTCKDAERRVDNIPLIISKPDVRQFALIHHSVHRLCCNYFILYPAKWGCNIQVRAHICT